MEKENGSVSTITFYISKNSFVSECYEEKQYLASNNVTIFLSFIATLWILIYFKTGKKYCRFVPVMLTSLLAVLTDGPAQTLL